METITFARTMCSEVKIERNIEKTMAVVGDNSMTRGGSSLLRVEKSEDCAVDEAGQRTLRLIESRKKNEEETCIMAETLNQEPIILTETNVMAKTQSQPIIPPTESMNITEKSHPTKLSHQSTSDHLCPSITRATIMTANGKSEDAPNILVYKKVKLSI